VRRWTLLALLLTAAPASAQEPLPAPFTGKVTRIVDGDGLYVEGQPLQIRLWGVAAPDRGEPGFKEATETLSRLAMGRTVRVEVIDRQPATDRFKARLVGRVYLDGQEVNAEAIRQGPAVQDCRFSKGAYGTCE
jgi:micrococcal nuclease